MKKIRAITVANMLVFALCFAESISARSTRGAAGFAMAIGMAVSTLLLARDE